MQNPHEEVAEGVMSPSAVLLIAYSEIALKGRKRGLMERALRDAVERWHRRRGRRVSVYLDSGRVVVGGEYDLDVARVPGVHHVMRALELEKLAPEGLAKAVAELLSPEPPVAVRVRRADKSYPMTSLELAAEVGRALGLPVDLKRPKTVIYVEVRNKVYVYTSEDVREGVGGLPYGVEGSVGVECEEPERGLVVSALLARRGSKVFPSKPYPHLDLLSEALPEPLVVREGVRPAAGRDLFPAAPCVPRKTLEKIKIMLGGVELEGLDSLGCPRPG